MAVIPTVEEMDTLRDICGEVRPLRDLTGGVTRKIGEGSKCEVFLSETQRRRTLEQSVLKIVPVGGDGQTMYKDAISELRATK